MCREPEKPDYHGFSYDDHDEHKEEHEGYDRHGVEVNRSSHFLDSNNFEHPNFLNSLGIFHFNQWL